MNRQRKTITWERWCSIEIPDDWTWSQEDNVISVFNESQGVGALQISFANRLLPHKPTNEEAVKLSLSYAGDQDWPVGAEMVQVSRVDESVMATMTHCRFGEEITSWRVWHIIEKTRVACITYNCVERDQDVEADSVDDILRSFRWRT
ncbi:MAG: hypothetical protein U0236_20720 [Nitrospira sp.]